MEGSRHGLLCRGFNECTLDRFRNHILPLLAKQRCQLRVTRQVRSHEPHERHLSTWVASWSILGALHTSWRLPVFRSIMQDQVFHAQWLWVSKLSRLPWGELFVMQFGNKMWHLWCRILCGKEFNLSLRKNGDRWFLERSSFRDYRRRLGCR